MTAQERAVMERHVAYRKSLLDEDKVVAFGLVADPPGGWGVSVIEADDEASVQSMIGGVPVKQSGDLGFREELQAMPAAVAR